MRLLCHVPVPKSIFIIIINSILESDIMFTGRVQGVPSTVQVKTKF